MADAKSPTPDDTPPGGTPSAPTPDDPTESAAERAAAFDPVVAWDEGEEVPFAPVNFGLIGSGIGALAVGFVLLRQVNGDASNWQGTWAPIILLTGYVLIFLGILYVRRGTPDADS